MKGRYCVALREVDQCLFERKLSFLQYFVTKPPERGGFVTKYCRKLSLRSNRHWSTSRRATQYRPFICYSPIANIYSGHVFEAPRRGCSNKAPGIWRET